MSIKNPYTMPGRHGRTTHKRFPKKTSVWRAQTQNPVTASIRGQSVILVAVDEAHLIPDFPIAKEAPNV